MQPLPRKASSPTRGGQNETAMSCGRSALHAVGPPCLLPTPVPAHLEGQYSEERQSNVPGPPCWFPPAPRPSSAGAEEWGREEGPGRSLCPAHPLPRSQITFPRCLFLPPQTSQRSLWHHRPRPPAAWRSQKVSVSLFASGDARVGGIRATGLPRATVGALLGAFGAPQAGSRRRSHRAFSQ